RASSTRAASDAGYRRSTSAVVPTAAIAPFAQATAASSITIGRSRSGPSNGPSPGGAVRSWAAETTRRSHFIGRVGSRLGGKGQLVLLGHGQRLGIARVGVAPDSGREIVGKGAAKAGEPRGRAVRHHHHAGVDRV